MTPRPPRRPTSRPGGTSRPPRRDVRPHREVRHDGVGGEQVEGRQAVLELLRAQRRRIERILVADGQDPSEILDQIEREAARRRVLVQLVSMTRLDREARTEGHQGVVAMAAPLPTESLETLLADSSAFLLVADGVTDPRNLGAMLRSADGAGVTGVVLPRHRSARVTATAAKTAVGAIEYLRFCDVPGIPNALLEMQRQGVRVVGLASESRSSLYDLDLSQGPVALVVGGEERGLAALTRKRCRDIVSIPQSGRISSLNAGVAVSIAAFEIARQRSRNVI